MVDSGALLLETKKGLNEFMKNLVIILFLFCFPLFCQSGFFSLPPGIPGTPTETTIGPIFCETGHVVLIASSGIIINLVTVSSTTTITISVAPGGGGGITGIDVDLVPLETPDGVITTFSSPVTFHQILSVKLDSMPLIKFDDWTDDGNNISFTLTPSFLSDQGGPPIPGENLRVTIQKP